MTAELEVLRRAHGLFAGPTARPAVRTAADAAITALDSAGATADAYQAAASDWRAQLDKARDVDARLIRILDEAYRDHLDARRSTGAVLTAARADAATMADNPIAARELIRRAVIRLRAQHAHVRTARERAERQRAALHRLRYRSHPGAGRGARAANAVRAALSRLGRPYVWGATGPDRFDCSGLVQWAYAQAGVRLHRTTYEQIHDGVPVPRSQIRPGDLVFPHTGHVQLAIGNGMVVEAPQPGATVQISRIGQAIAIRRPA
ncbi:MAG: C40 family peptidase [Mycobacteriaceae bacterium]